MAVENFSNRIRAAIANWSADYPTGENVLFKTRIQLHPKHVESILEEVMPVVEQIIKSGGK